MEGISILLCLDGNCYLEKRHQNLVHISLLLLLSPHSKSLRDWLWFLRVFFPTLYSSFLEREVHIHSNQDRNHFNNPPSMVTTTTKTMTSGNYRRWSLRRHDKLQERQKNRNTGLCNNSRRVHLTKVVKLWWRGGEEWGLNEWMTEQKLHSQAETRFIIA